MLNGIQTVENNLQECPGKDLGVGRVCILHEFHEGEPSFSIVWMRAVEKSVYITLSLHRHQMRDVNTT